jgi:hypothetical protein
MNKNIFLVAGASLLLCFCQSGSRLADSGSDPENSFGEISLVEETDSIFPLVDGWYLYDFNRLSRGIGNEYTYAQSGIDFKQEITLKQQGTIAWCEAGVIYDPALELALSVDSEGTIRSPGNASVTGHLNSDGSFYWTGLINQSESLNHATVTGKLTAITQAMKAGNEYDGLFTLVDNGTGRKQIARVSDGFYTWHYDDGDDTGFTPWPMLVYPDGSFSFDLEMITIMQIGEYSGTKFSTSVSSQGNVIPGRGVNLEVVTLTSGLTDSNDVPETQVYGGTQISNNEVPNDAIPQNIDSLVKSKAIAVKGQPAVDTSKYPAWYLQPPSAPGFIHAAGYHRFEDEKTALGLAEAAAAAEISAIIRIRLHDETIETTSGDRTRIDSRMRTETAEKIAYKIIEKIYRVSTGEAFILLEYKAP